MKNANIHNLVFSVSSMIIVKYFIGFNFKNESNENIFEYRYHKKGHYFKYWMQNSFRACVRA